jgi:hypothetical protein
MANVNKIIGSLATAINKVSGSAISGLSKIMGATISLFTDTQAVAKSVTTGSGNAVYITDSDGDYTYDQADAFTISFWIKPGWTTALNTNTHLLASSDVAGGGANADSFRLYYYENNNRLYVEWRSDASNKCRNFWIFHSNSGVYADAYAAAGLGTSYWSNTNRGNVGDDDYTLITVTRGTANTACYTNLKLYWNAADCGEGFYSVANGQSCGEDTGTPSMGNNDKQIALGSQSWGSFAKCGNINNTDFDGFSIWDKVLSSAEVSEIYNGGTPMNLENHSAAANLKGFWNFEGDGNNTVSGAPAFTINGDSGIITK